MLKVDQFKWPELNSAWLTQFNEQWLSGLN